MTSNYDLNNDVDDKTFLENSKPNYNKPSSAAAEFERKHQLLLLEKSKLEDSCLSTTKTSLALINESEQIGIKTGVELLEQREKLGRIENDLDTISSVTKQSRKHLNAMNSGIVGFMFGGIKTMIKKPKGDKKGKSDKLKNSQSANNLKDNQLNNTINKLRNNNTHDCVNQNTNGSGTAIQKKQTTESKEKNFNDKLDDQLIEIQSGVGRLKDLALGLGGEIASQNEQLDVITNKADKANAGLEEHNKQIIKKLKE